MNYYVVISGEKQDGGDRHLGFRRKFLVSEKNYSTYEQF